MAYTLQKFQDGVIKRAGNKYQFVVNAKVKGSYDSVDELVKAQTAQDTTEKKLRSKKTK